MISLLIIPIIWCAIAAGRTVCGLARMPKSATPLETTLLACGIGLGLLAYGVLAIGLVGSLTAPAIAGVIVVVAAIGA